MDINVISMPLGLYVKGKGGQYKLRDVLANIHTHVAAAGLRSPLGYEVLAVLREQPVFIQTYLLG